MLKFSTPSTEPFGLTAQSNLAASAGTTVSSPWPTLLIDQQLAVLLWAIALGLAYLTVRR